MTTFLDSLVGAVRACRCIGGDSQSHWLFRMFGDVCKACVNTPKSGESGAPGECRVVARELRARWERSDRSALLFRE
jgi:sugar (pentulose or hexulose) kinase